MTEILSQEEIDKLLKDSLGGGSSEEEEIPFARPKSKPSATPVAIDQGQPSFDALMGLKKGAKLKRSPVLDDEIKVKVQPASFPSFDHQKTASENTELGTILEIKLEIRVELGKTYLTLGEVLDMGAGSVIELDKQNGEPVDMVVNKKGFAKGEMIVIGENFGARITDILSVQEIIEALR